jgi:hypothetical protein
MKLLRLFCCVENVGIEGGEVDVEIAWGSLLLFIVFKWKESM